MWNLLIRKSKEHQQLVGNGKTKPDGLWNEHILTRKERVLKMIDMVIHDGLVEVS